MKRSATASSAAAALLALALQGPALAEGPVPFGPRQVVDQSGDNPRTVIAVDLDQDGDLDLVHTLLADNQLRWHESSGGEDPTFTTRVISMVTERAREVVAADVDRDGDVDLAVASSQDKSIRWFENLGGSPLSFAEHVVENNLTNAWSVAVADVDGDGDMDVLSAGAAEEDTINWHENVNGDESVWVRHIVDDMANRAQKVIADDVDGDGDVDLLSASSAGGVREIAWYENDGAADPTFTKHILTSTLTQAKWVSTGDVDGDGDVDILGIGEFEGEIRWWESDGAADPTFTEHTVDFVDGGKTVEAVDLDRDGDLDLIAHGIVFDEIVFFENDGAENPTFTRRLITTESDNPLTVVAADLDKDGDPDLAASSFADDTIGWYENLSTRLSASIESAPIVLQSGLTPFALASADLDRDGREDLIEASRDDSSVWWHRNLGGSPTAFERRLINDGFAGNRDVVASDLNGDGLVDVVSAARDSDAVVWHRNDGGIPAAFTSEQIGTVNRVRAVATLDVDQDADLDVLAISLDDDSVVLLRNSGGSAPAFASSVAAASVDDGAAIATGDLNRDGWMDAVVASRGTNELVVLVNNADGTGTFTAVPAAGMVDQPKMLAVADFDCDGDLDLVSGSSTAGTVTVHENLDPDALTFQLRTLTAGAPADVKSLAVADADLDGDLDVLVSGGGSGNVVWFERIGAWEVQPVTVLTGLTRPSDNLWVDVTGDGMPDVVASDDSENDVVVQEIRRLETTLDAQATAVSTAPTEIFELSQTGLFTATVEHLLASDLGSIEVVDLEVRAELGDGQAASRSTLNEIVLAMSLHLDDGDGEFNGLSDPIIGSAENPVFDSFGRLTLAPDVPLGLLPGETELIHVTILLEQSATETVEEPLRFVLDTELITLTSADGEVERGASATAETPLLRPVPRLENRTQGLPWKRHTVDNTLLGAESTRAADFDGDGLLDLITAWEQSALVTLYLNPGADAATAPWPRVDAGIVTGAETVFPVDLDGDGRLDIASAQENGEISLSFAPPPGEAIDDASAWVTITIDTIPAERWGPLAAIDIDGQNGPDLVFGALGVNGDFDVPMAWLQAPADPRDASGWTYYVLGEAAFVTSIIGRDMDGDGDQDVVWTDRLFSADERAAWWYENPGGAALFKPWEKRLLGAAERYPMIMDLADIDQDGLEDAVVPDRRFFPVWMRRLDSTGLAWESNDVLWPSDMGRPKAFRVGDIDLDGHPDIVATAVQALEFGDLRGVCWIRQEPGGPVPTWTGQTISNGEGEKFDRIELVDVDLDGDLDVITAEERNNSQDIFGLGVVWYENPLIELDGDIDGDGRTGTRDLAALLAAWGAAAPRAVEDLNNDGVVGPADLATLLSSWGNEDG